jgi:hypothetical protein
MKGETNNEQRPTALERPEATDEKIVRVAVRFFGIAADEGLTPYEMAVAWQRIARTILREAFFKIAMGAFLRTLALEIVEEMPTVPGQVVREEGGAA